MCQNQSFTELLVRNEDWLIANILGYANSFKHPLYSAIINHPWRYSVNNLSNILISHIHPFKTQESADSRFDYIKHNIFTNYALSEAEKCLNRNIPAYIYLTFLKVLHTNYTKLLNSSNLIHDLKQDCTSYLGNSFNCLDITYAKTYNSLENPRMYESTFNTDKQDSYHILFQSIPIPALVINPFFKVVESNRAAKLRFSNLNESGTQELKKALNNKYLDEIYSGIDSMHVSHKKDCSFETYLPIDNIEYFYEISLHKIKSSENILLTFTNLSKWKDIEKNLEQAKGKAIESDKSKTAFLANMSHEIRTPMNAIVGFAELLTITNPTQKERDDYLSLIKKSSNDLLNIIEDVIDISKIESKQLNIIPKSTSLFELLYDIEKIYSEALVKNGKNEVKIKLTIPETEEKIKIKTDPNRLKQVLCNLIGNAVKFTEKGLIEIGYKVAADKLVYFYVKDTGVGIPVNMQKKIFDRFVQVEEALSKNTGGTGLGLAISKNIINLLGGNIWVTSKPNVGSNFYFYLPYITENETSNLNPGKSSESISKKVDLSNYKILIAEDEDTNFSYLNEILRNTGIKIVRARNGFEAINIVENDVRIDLILMDIKMPEIDGLEASQYISHVKPELPIIAQTAFAMDIDKQSCFEAGCVDYLSKPIKIDNLLNLIYKYIKGKSKETANSHI